MEIQTALTWRFSSLLTGSAQIPKVLKFFLGTPRCFYYTTKKKCGHDYSWFHFTEYASILKSFDPPFVTKSLIPWTKDTFQYIHAQLLQSCPALCDPRSRSPWVSSVPGVVQARTLEWVAVPSSRGSSRPGIQPVSLRSTCIGRQVLITSSLVSPGKPTPFGSKWDLVKIRPFLWNWS